MAIVAVYHMPCYTDGLCVLQQCRIAVCREVGLRKGFNLGEVAEVAMGEFGYGCALILRANEGRDGRDRAERNGDRAQIDRQHNSLLEFARLAAFARGVGVRRTHGFI